MRRLLCVVILAAFAATPVVAQEGTRPLATFDDQAPGKPPEGWRARGGDAEDVYVVRQDGDNRKYLHADARGVSVQIGKELELDVRRFPVLSWRWRVLALPPGDERTRERGDSAAGVYVVFGGWPIPNTIKYVWSASLPRGTRTESPFAGQTKIVVLRSGMSDAGQWVEERVNVLEDYRKLFGKNPDPAKGIALLSDSDNTKSRAVADYDAIVAHPAGAARSGAASISGAAPK